MFTECPKVQAPARLGNPIVNAAGVWRLLLRQIQQLKKKKKLKKKQEKEIDW
jgi:hypothetical protein